MEQNVNRMIGLVLFGVFSLTFYLIYVNTAQAKLIFKVSLNTIAVALSSGKSKPENPLHERRIAASLNTAVTNSSARTMKSSFERTPTVKDQTLLKPLQHSTIHSKMIENDLIMELMPGAGLANRLFMYASALGIALTNNRNLKIYPVIEEMKVNLNISKTWVTHFNRFEYRRLEYGRCCLYYQESENLENKKIHLFGFLVSWKYFHKYRDIILREFAFSSPIKDETNRFLSNIRVSKVNLTLIGVHVRRGDFITHEGLGYTVATESYIARAVNYYQQRFNCLFVIATNDRTWAELVFANLTNTQYVFTGMSSPYTDISIVSSCDHVITTTGTFSWWIGYLSKGIVLYYKQFPREGSWLRKTQFGNMDDYFLPEWIGLM